MRLSVLINTLRRPDLLAEALESLGTCDPLPYEVVIIDGDASKSAEPVAAEFARRPGFPSVTYETSPPGMTVQRNRALAAARGDVILITDDDVNFEREVFGALLAAYADPSVIGATGHVIQSYRRFGGERSRLRRLVTGRAQGTMTSFGYPRRIRDTENPRDVEFMQGCMMSARRDSALHVGFDERLGAYGLEDEDFSYRLSRLGRLRYVPEAVIHHKTLGFATSDPRYFSRLMVVQRAYLFRKNFRRTTLTRAKFGAFMVVMAAYRAINRDWRGLIGVAEGCWLAWRQGRAARVPQQP